MSIWSRDRVHYRCSFGPLIAIRGPDLKPSFSLGFYIRVDGVYTSCVHDGLGPKGPPAAFGAVPDVLMPQAASRTITGQIDVYLMQLDKNIRVSITTALGQHHFAASSAYVSLSSQCADFFPLTTNCKGLEICKRRIMKNGAKVY